MVVLVTLEAAWRAWRAKPPGATSQRATALLLILVGVTGAGGLGLFVAGGRPSEGLHFVYGPLALAILPLATSLTQTRPPRTRAVATLLACLVSLIVIARLYGTG